MVSNFGLAWQQSFGIIVVLYFYSHYLFASGAAHIGAMYTAFLSVAIACGTPGLLAAVALGQVTAPSHSAYASLANHSCLRHCVHTGHKDNPYPEGCLNAGACLRPLVDAATPGAPTSTERNKF